MNRSTYVNIFYSLFFAISTIATASAEPDTENSSICVWDTCVPKTKTIEGQTLMLRGVSPFRYWGFKVYASALYAPAEINDIETSLGSVPMRLEIHYYRDFSAEDFRESGTKVFMQNPAAETYDFSSQLKAINSLYQPVREQDSYSLDFIPGEGLTLSLNNMALGTVVGDKFAGAYLGIWLSRYSLSSSLTKELTGG